MSGRWKLSVGLAVVLGAIAVLSLVVGGASSATVHKSSTRSQHAASSLARTKAAARPYIVYLSGPLNQPITVAMDKGMIAGGQATGAKVQYATTTNLANFVPDMTTLIRQTIARHPSAIVLCNFFPSSFDPLIKQAAKAGIPVVVCNTGLDSYVADGAIGFVGEVPAISGKIAGQALVTAGMHNVVCVNTSPQNPVPLQRCNAAKAVLQKAGGSMTVENIPLAQVTNPAAITSDVQGYLSSHKNIDGVLTVAAQSAPDAVAAVKNLGKSGKIKVGTFDIELDVLQAIQAGSIAFATDQQPFLQGYYPVVIAAQYVTYGLRPTEPIDTGGFIVTKANVGKYLTVNKNHPGVIGAG